MFAPSSSFARSLRVASAASIASPWYPQTREPAGMSSSAKTPRPHPPGARRTLSLWTTPRRDERFTHSGPQRHAAPHSRMTPTPNPMSSRSASDPAGSHTARFRRPFASYAGSPSAFLQHVQRVGSHGRSGAQSQPRVTTTSPSTPPAPPPKHEATYSNPGGISEPSPRRTGVGSDPRETSTMVRRARRDE